MSLASSDISLGLLVLFFFLLLGVFFIVKGLFPLRIPLAGLAESEQPPKLIWLKTSDLWAR